MLHMKHDTCPVFFISSHQILSSYWTREELWMLLVKEGILHLEETALWLLGLLAGMRVDFTV